MRSIIFVVLLLVGSFALQACANESAAPATTAGKSPIVFAELSPQQYQDEFVTKKTSHLLLDVRTPEEYASGHIPGALNIEIDALESRLGEVGKDQPVILYCQSGNRSSRAAKMLQSAGYTQIYDLGGIRDWIAQGLPTE